MARGTGTDDKTLGRKVLDGAKYVGKNFLKVLPVGSLINYVNKVKKGLTKETPLKDFLHTSYIAVPIVYVFLGVISDIWTPKQWREYNEGIMKRTEYIKSVNSDYSKFFEDAKTFQDSLKIYQEYGLPINLLPPTLEQKEKAIKQNELERSVE